MLVRVGTDEDKEIRVPITTYNQEGRKYNRVKTLRPHRFLFGTVERICAEEKEVIKPVLNEEGEVVVDGDGNIVTKVVKPAKLVALVRWAGPKYRTSILPVETLIPAVAEIPQ